MTRSALVVGATGLVGARLVAALLASPGDGPVHVLVRRPMAPEHPRLRQHVVDFDRLATVAWPDVADVYCCLGTTMRAAGSQDAFRRVDYDYPLAIARATRDRGARQFLFVSALGAAAASPVFYNRVKGELEAAIAALAFPAAVAFRPSLLAGDRAEHRTGERLALALLTPLSSLVPRRYRPVAAAAVARAMVDYAGRGLLGFHVVASAEIQAFAPD